jgi:4-hydroxy-3-polyprenylbenzoate decarboxylase
MLALAELGVHMVPAMPAFYQHPQTVSDLVDFVVGRVLEALDLPHELYPAWNSRMR